MSGGVRLATAAEATAGTATNAVPVVKRVKDMIDVLAAALASQIAAKATPADITAAINALKGGVDPAYDTLIEIAAKLADDDTAIAGILTALGSRLRFDAAQSLSAPQKAQALANLALGSVSGGGLATGGGDLSANRTITVPVASQAEAEAGSATDRAMTPERVKQAIAALMPPVGGTLVAIDLYTTSQTLTIKGATAIVEMVGPSGGEGGSSAGGGQQAPSGGAYLYKVLTGLGVGLTLSYAHGAPGAAGATMGGSGGNGGSHVLSSGSQAIATLTCPGGKGSVTLVETPGSALPTGGDINLPSDPVSIDAAFGGNPAFPWGKGGTPRTTGTGSGNPGIGYGAGPGKGIISQSVGLVGLIGGPGLTRIYWFK